MNDQDLNALLGEAASSAEPLPDGPGLRRRLRQVDLRRRLGAMSAAVAVVASVTVGVAAAWPEPPTAVDVKVGGDPEVGHDPAPDPNVPEPVPAPADDEDAAGPAVPFLGGETHDVAAASPALPAEPTLVLDFGAGFELAPIEAPTPGPSAPAHPPAAAAPEVAHEPVPRPTTAPAHDQEEAAPKKKRKAKQTAFTAVAQYGSCEEPIPYDMYSGTTAPGATVTITSPWSATTTTTAAGDGHWSVRVTFEAAPVGQPFTVTAASGGRTVGLSFVRTG